MLDYRTAQQLDAQDPFQPLTHLFDMPLAKDGKPAIYLNGNSLGPKPKSVAQALLQTCGDWGNLGVRGHFVASPPWVSCNEIATHSLARLVGAQEQEVVATGTLTSNLHTLFVSFYQPTPQRFKIIRLAGFPSDTYALTSQVQQRLATLQQFTATQPFTVADAIIEIKPDSQHYIAPDTFKKVLEEHGDSTAIIWIEAVHYLTGQYFNIAEIAGLAQQKGCKIGLDLAHAIGNVPLQLHHWNIDFAVWCSYKYLSAGPGAVGGLYVHEKYLRDPNMLRFSGWWGHNKSTRFAMPAVFDPIPSAQSWEISNPNVLSLVALREALTIFDRVDFHALREKNKRLVAYLENLLRSELSNEVNIITPHNAEERGCQLSLRVHAFKQKNAIEEILFSQSIIADVRGDLIRVAPMGLYTTFTDVFNFVEKLKKILKI